MKCPGQDRKLYPGFSKMNNSYDKKLIIRFGWYEKDGTDGRKYIEEDGETGLINEIPEGEFVRKHKKYAIENCITGIEGEMLEVRKELYPEKTIIRWTMKEIKRILLGKLRGRNILMHRDGLNRNLIIMNDKGKFIEMKQMRYGTSRQRERVNALKELAKDGIIKLETLSKDEYQMKFI